MIFIENKVRDVYFIALENRENLIWKGRKKILKIADVLSTKRVYKKSVVLIVFL